MPYTIKKGVSPHDELLKPECGKQWYAICKTCGQIDRYSATEPATTPKPKFLPGHPFDDAKDCLCCGSLVFLEKQRIYKCPKCLATGNVGNDLSSVGNTLKCETCNGKGWKTFPE